MPVLRSICAGATVVVGAAVGVITNVVTARWSVALAVGLGVLVVVGVALQVVLSVAEGHASGGHGVRLRATARHGGRVIQAGRDIQINPTSPDRPGE